MIGREECEVDTDVLAANTTELEKIAVTMETDNRLTRMA
ncbi:hypothetical protein JCM19235_1916 [Vibrio maritimus]|uniref:Uncharacterized protein n=1 Tax=Vibrio maritimus TaxID=990268 RepID=A0A090RVE4_9VIBR|nr:hypothetical protein JCM19235_1916 [Vibrio maritimus]